MKVQKLLVLCFGIMLILTGCEHSNSPTSLNVLDERQLQAAPTRPSDDTADSEIVSPQYPEGTTVIAAIGDSITYGKYSSRSYPSILEEKLRAAGYNVVVLNEGIPGDSSPETHKRFLKVIAGVDIALIMIGTNDTINPGGRDINTIGNITAMLDEALISKTIPIVSTVTPACPGSDYEWANGKIWYLNADIYSVAIARNVIVVDNYTAILNNGGESLYANSVHFNEWGNDVLAQQWYQAIVDNQLIAPPVEPPQDEVDPETTP